MDGTTTAYVELADRRGTVHQVPLLGVPDFEAAHGDFHGPDWRVTGVGLRPEALVLETPGCEPFRLEVGRRVVLVTDSRDAWPPGWGKHREQPPDGHTDDGRPYWF